MLKPYTDESYNYVHVRQSVYLSLAMNGFDLGYPRDHTISKLMIGDRRRINEKPQNWTRLRISRTFVSAAKKTHFMELHLDRSNSKNQPTLLHLEELVLQQRKIKNNVRFKWKISSFTRTEPQRLIWTWNQLLMTRTNMVFCFHYENSFSSFRHVWLPFNR